MFDGVVPQPDASPKTHSLDSDSERFLPRGAGLHVPDAPQPLAYAGEHLDGIHTSRLFGYVL